MYQKNMFQSLKMWFIIKEDWWIKNKAFNDNIKLHVYLHQHANVCENVSEKYQDQSVRKQQLSSFKYELITWQHDSSKVSEKDIWNKIQYNMKYCLMLYYLILLYLVNFFTFLF